MLAQPFLPLGWGPSGPGSAAPGWSPKATCAPRHPPGAASLTLATQKKGPAARRSPRSWRVQVCEVPAQCGTCSTCSCYVLLVSPRPLCLRLFLSGAKHFAGTVGNSSCHLVWQLTGQGVPEPRTHWPRMHSACCMQGQRQSWQRPVPATRAALVYGGRTSKTVRAEHENQEEAS